MKALIEISENKGCVDCPYCRYKEDFYDDNGYVDSSKDGFYCEHFKKPLKIADFYNTEDGNGLIIPDYCPLEVIDKNKKQMEKKSYLFTVDFDNTCALEKFPDVGEDVPTAPMVLREMVRKGHKIILWTCRSGKQLEDAVAWFKERNIELFGVNDNPEPDPDLAKTYGIPRKVIGDFNIDDRNLGCPTFEYKDEETGKFFKVVDWWALRKWMLEKEIL